MTFGNSPAQYVKTVRFPVVLLYLCVSLCLGVLLTACDDPTNVGEELVGAQGGHPETTQIPIGDLQPGDLVRPLNAPSRIVAGRVDDPALGAFVVEGYFDLTPVSSANFRAQPIERAELRLRPSYVYGDTTSEVTLALRDVTEEWDPAGLPTDTSFSVGPVIREFSFVPTDTLVVVSLPESWVEEHVDVFRSTDLGALLHGFRLDPVAGNAVVGFGPDGTTLFAATADEALSLPVGASYQRVERPATAELPPDRFLLQAGAGPIASFSLIEGDENLPSSSVNRATLAFWTDTLTVNENMPAHFVRPTLRTLDLYAVTLEGNSTLLARNTLNEEGQFVFDSQILARAFQEMLVGSQRFERFEIRIPIPNPNAAPGTQGEMQFYYTSLNPVVLFDTGAGDRAPIGYLTITPID